MGMDASGEFFIPGRFPKRTEDEHLERYYFASKFVKDKSVLDIACGAGYGSKMLAEAGAASVQGVDIGEDMVLYARQNFQSDIVNFSTGDVTNYGVSDAYDVVTSFETIEHVEDYKAALSNIFRVLKPGGILILSTPNRPMSWRPVKTMHDKPRNPFHVREFELNEMVEIVREQNFVLGVENILGQRQFLHIPNRYIRKIYSMLLHPEDRATANVKPLSLLKQPKYIVLVASKP